VQAIEMIDAALNLRASSSDPMTSARRFSLQRLRDRIASRGLTFTEGEKREFCLMPVIFQELNYDDFDWSRRENRLGALDDMVEIDVVAWSGGFRRSEISDSEYRRYWRHCLDVIDYRKEASRRK